MARLVLVDGTFELFRGFYGAPSRATAGGFEYGAALAVCRSLLALAQRADVSHVAVAFDTEIESFRNELYQGYKTGEGIEPPLLAQFPLVEALCEAAGFSVHRMIRYEADDALATLAARFADDPTLDQIVIASPDKDLTQCVVAQRVVTWDRIRDRFFDHAGVIARLGVRPDQVPDFLALVGDSADGIPGVPRWGAKSTAAVLSAYPHLEDIPDDADQWTVPVRGKAALADSLRGMRAQAELFRRLATLVTDVPLEVELEALVPRRPSRDAVAAVASSYEAPELLSAWERGLRSEQALE